MNSSYNQQQVLRDHWVKESLNGRIVILYCFVNLKIHILKFGALIWSSGFSTASNLKFIHFTN